jgi:membrane-bound lytic murein transglycosylase A
MLAHMRCRPSHPAPPPSATAWGRAALPLLAGLALMALAGCGQQREVAAPPPPAKNYAAQLPPGASALREVDAGTLPPLAPTPEERTALRHGIANSLIFFTHAGSGRWFPVDGITPDQVVASLRLLDQLLATIDDPQALTQAVRTRFRIFESVGCDGEGTVLYTGYFTPVWPASRQQDARFRFPLYRRPADLVMPPQGGDPAAGPAQQRLPDGRLAPFPVRAEIDASGMLKGHELVWMEDAFDAYCVELQGSAKLQLSDGERIEIGYHGTNNYPYQSIAEQLVASGKIPRQGLNFFTVRAYFHAHPEEEIPAIERNPRMVFFQESHGGPYGQLGQPVIADVSIATDKHIFPAGAPCLVRTQVSDAAGQRVPYSALRLDQDTGGGVRAAGRVDLYMGEGADAEQRAGAQYQEGRLFYLIARP